MRHAVLLAIVLLSIGATTPPLHAAIISETITASVSNFTVLGTPVTPPIDPAQITFSITFDDSIGVENQTAGLTLISSNLPLGSGFGYTYRLGTDILAVGGLQGNVVGGTAGTDDYSFAFSNASATPAIFDMFYELSGQPLSLFTSSSGTVTATPLPTPEPAPLGLLAAGLGVLGLVRRQRRTTAARTFSPASRRPADGGACAPAGMTGLGQ